MLNKTDDVVLEIQNILMKTYKGRNISDKAKEAVSSWKKMAGSFILSARIRALPQSIRNRFCEAKRYAITPKT